MTKSLLCILLFTVAGFAQNPPIMSEGNPTAPLPSNAPIPTQTFSFQTSAISLPGNRGTFVGSDSGVTFAPTQNFSISEHSILSSDARLAYFGAGPDYQLPYLSLRANNAMPNLSGFRMLFSLGGSFGVARVKDDLGNVAQHYGGEAHGAFSYSLSSTGSWQLGVRAGAMRAPYYARGWFPVVSFGPSFHF